MSEQDELQSPVFGSLALNVDPVKPPIGLRERILAAAQAADREGGAARVVPLRRRPRPPLSSRMPLGAVAALVVVALIAGLLVGGAVGRLTAPPPPAQVAHFTLEGHGPMAGASATVIDLKQDGIALVSFSGLPAAPEGKLYELWLIGPDNHADPAGIFLPDPNGQRLIVVERPLAGYKLMAVTVEAAPEGVASPTQQPQLYGTVV